ncbi:MAG: MBL fold metallo-hydrolase [Acidaminococcus sp.]|uniref:MBL fold metallo-hydrolase n=1 Tax=Acidaminococcus sp. TaxID=1872103 RepID=UPI003F1609CC
MEILFLGTGHAISTRCYNTCYVLRQNERYLLVDGGGGNGILRQLQRAKLPWQKVKDIFVTHRHMDHVLGIFWLIRMIVKAMRRGTYTGEARIYGHDEMIHLLRTTAPLLLDPVDLPYLDNRLHFIEVKDGETRKIRGWDVTFFDIHSTKAKQFGYTLESHGHKLGCCGDEPMNDANFTRLSGSEWLLHEAFCLYRDRDRYRPYEKHHSTVKEACENGERLQVPNLVLYHTEDNHLAQRKALYTEEGKAYYGGNLFVPDDLETLKLW